MWGELYIVGSTSLTGHNWDYYFQCSSDETASFKTIAAGTHYFKVANAIDGRGWSTVNCINSYSGSTISSAGKQSDGIGDAVIPLLIMALIYMLVAYRRKTKVSDLCS